VSTRKVSWNVVTSGVVWRCALIDARTTLFHLH